MPFLEQELPGIRRRGQSKVVDWVLRDSALFLLMRAPKTDRETDMVYAGGEMRITANA